MQVRSIHCLAIGLSLHFLGITCQAQEKADIVSQENSALLRPWSGPYGGVPPWNEVHPEEFVTAFKLAIEEATREIETISTNAAPATFENTIVELEQVAGTLNRLNAIFGVHSSNLNVGPIGDIERTVVPLLSEYADSVTQNGPLFSRIEQVYEGPEFANLDPTQQRLTNDLYKQFVRQGAKLSTVEKKRLSAINKRLASLFTNFSQNVLADEANYVTWIDSQTDLVGLPESVVTAMANEAKSKGQPNKWAVTNTRSSMEPFLTYADNRDLRRKVWRTYYDRGDNGDEYDNNGIISEILKAARPASGVTGLSVARSLAS